MPIYNDQSPLSLGISLAVAPNAITNGNDALLRAVLTYPHQYPFKSIWRKAKNGQKLASER